MPWVLRDRDEEEDDPDTLLFSTGTNIDEADALNITHNAMYKVWSINITSALSKNCIEWRLYTFTHVSLSIEWPSEWSKLVRKELFEFIVRFIYLFLTGIILFILLGQLTQILQYEGRPR